MLKKIILLIIPLISTFSYAENECLRIKDFTSEDLKKIEDSKNPNINKQPYSVSREKSQLYHDNLDKVTIPNDLKQCKEYHLSKDASLKLQVEWMYLAINYPENLNFIYNHKLLLAIGMSRLMGGEK